MLFFLFFLFFYSHEVLWLLARLRLLSIDVSDWLLLAAAIAMRATRVTAARMMTDWLFFGENRLREATQLFKVKVVIDWLRICFSECLS